TVASDLLNPETKEAYIQKIKSDYETTRDNYNRKKVDKTLVPIAFARENKYKIDWSAPIAPAPKFIGTKILDNYPLEELVPYIDWTPFFHTWELRGSYPKIFDDQYVGVEAKKLFNDAQVLLKRIVDEKLLKAKAVFGFWPANAVGDDIQLSIDSDNNGQGATGSEQLKTITIHTLRQQVEKPKGEP